MKIAIVNPSLRYGGAEHFTVTLANSFSQKENNTIFLITNQPKENEYRLSKKVFRSALLSEKTSLVSMIKDVKSISAFVKKNDVDLLVGIGIYPNICVCIAKLLVRAKVVISERNSPQHDLISLKSRLLRFLFWRFADGYVFQTEEAQRFYSSRIQSRSCVIHNPVTEGLPQREKKTKQQIVAVGRLEPQKDYTTMIQAFELVHEKYPAYILRIFGQGSEEYTLRELVKKLKIDQYVRFEGFHLDVHQQIENSDIYVLSSLFEGMPNSLMEAMAMGFPVVSTDCPSGGPRELIQSGSNGFLVPVGNPKALAEKICFFIENPQEKEKISQKASLLRETHSVENITRQWEAFLKSI